MVDTPTKTRKQLLANDFRRTAAGIQQGMMSGPGGRNGGGALGAAMGFMGAPNLAPQRGWGAGGNGSAMFDWPSLHGGGGKDPNDPNNPGNPDDPMLKAGLPQWWIDWLHSSGQYGGVPPTGGLLD